MAVYSSKYSIELYNAQGQLLIDLAGIARSRNFKLSRNMADIIVFAMDLDKFEAYCRENNKVPADLLLINSTEVLVKRGGTYIAGGQVNYTNVSVTAKGKTIVVRAIGFLNLFKKRYTGTTSSGTVQENYTGTASLSRQDLAWELIRQSQALTNGNFGITRGETKASTTKYDKSYSRTNIQDALQDMTKLQTAPLDIEFTPKKVFNCYASIGSDRPDIIFEYPSSNIKSFDAPNDGTDTANEIIGVGQGNGRDSAPVYFAEDYISQANVKLRQEVFISNAVDNTNDGLSNSTEAELAVISKALRIPAIVVDGNMAPFVTDYHIGDRVKIKIGNIGFLNYINDMYRIETIQVDVDDNDSEEITLQVSK